MSFFTVSMLSTASQLRVWKIRFYVKTSISILSYKEHVFISSELSTYLQITIRPIPNHRGHNIDKTAL